MLNHPSPAPAPVSLDALRARLRRAEGGFGDPSLRRYVPTGLALLDRALAGGGLPGAAVTAILSAGGGPGEAAWTIAVLFAAAVLRGAEAPGEAVRAVETPADLRAWLALARGGHKSSGVSRSVGGCGRGSVAARSACNGSAVTPVSGASSVVVLVDRAGDLYPPGVAELGVGLERTLFVRPARARDSPWALEEALRSPAVTVAVGDARRPAPAEVRRLELAAEAGGGIGIVLAREREAGALARVPVVLRVRPRLAAAVPSAEAKVLAPLPLVFAVEVVRSRGRLSGEEEVIVHAGPVPMCHLPGAGHGPAGAERAQASA